MSKRQEIQEDIADHIRSVGHFNAPYGVIEGMQPMGRGKKRTISFGVSRTLDATIDIVSPKNIQLSGRGPLAGAWGIEWANKFESADELKRFINEHTKNWN